MVAPDPALGISTSFDADRFRSAIRFAMQMGTPPEVAKRATFTFRPTGERTYTKNGVEVLNPRLDRDGKPLDPEIEVHEQAPQSVTVDCAVEVTRADVDELPVGSFRPTKAIVTVLDQQYELIKGCKEMLFDGDRYLYGYEPEGLGMFTVGINTLIFYALDES